MTGLSLAPVVTDRVSLELIDVALAADLVAAETGPAGRHADWHPDFPREDDCDPVRGLAAVDRWGSRLVRRLADGLVVGTIGFFGPPQDRDGMSEVEVGFGLVHGARGVGLMGHALRALLEHTDAGGVRVRAGTSADNAASLALLRSVGFVVRPAADAAADDGPVDADGPDREVVLVREVPR